MLSGAVVEVELKGVFATDIAEEADLPLVVLSKGIGPCPLQTLVQSQQRINRALLLGLCEKQ